MLSDLALEYIVCGVRRCLAVNPMRAMSTPPSKHLDMAIQGMREIADDPRGEQTAQELEANRHEAERAIAGALGMM